MEQVLLSYIIPPTVEMLHKNTLFKTTVAHKFKYFTAVSKRSVLPYGLVGHDDPWGGVNILL